MNKLLGAVVLAVGILIMGTTGLCSLFVFSGLKDYYDSETRLTMVAIFGTIPFAIGIIVIFAGRTLMRSAKTRGELEQ